MQSRREPPPDHEQRGVPGGELFDDIPGFDVVDGELMPREEPTVGGLPDTPDVAAD